MYNKDSYCTCIYCTDFYLLTSCVHILMYWRLYVKENIGFFIFQSIHPFTFNIWFPTCNFCLDHFHFSVLMLLGLHLFVFSLVGMLLFPNPKVLVLWLVKILHLINELSLNDFRLIFIAKLEYWYSDKKSVIYITPTNCSCFSLMTTWVI